MTGTPLQDVLAAVTGLAMLAVLLFIVVYARLPWWRTGLSRTIMASALALALLTGVGVVRRIDARWDAVHLTDQLAWGSVAAYIAVAVVYTFWAASIFHDDEGGD